MLPLRQNIFRPIRSTECFILTCFVWIAILFIYRESLPNAPTIILSYFPKRSMDIFNTHISHTDPIVLQYLKDHHLIPPPPRDEPYQLVATVDALSARALPYANILQADTKKGFFIECGANDGEFNTNTFGLEAKFNWDGLLIESSSTLFKTMAKKKRKAWLADICLSGAIEKMEFLMSNKTDWNWRFATGKLKPGKYKEPRKDDVWGYKKEDYNVEGIVECFPLESVLSAIGVTTVDFFSLDVEGHEYEILKNIPFDKIDIKLLFVEHYWIPEGGAVVKKLMSEHGFTLIKETNQDYLFKKN